jgi:hypothetical protein
MAATGRVGWTTEEEDAREGGAPEGGEEAGVSVIASPPSAYRDISGHHMPPSLDLAHRWAWRLTREGGGAGNGDLRRRARAATRLAGRRRATRGGVLAEVDGGLGTVALFQIGDNLEVQGSLRARRIARGG